MKVKFCMECGTPRVEGAKFCMSCGTPFPIEEDTQIINEDTKPVKNTQQDKDKSKNKNNSKKDKDSNKDNQRKKAKTASPTKDSSTKTKNNKNKESIISVTPFIVVDEVKENKNKKNIVKEEIKPVVNKEELSNNKRSIKELQKEEKPKHIKQEDKPPIDKEVNKKTTEQRKEKSSGPKMGSLEMFIQASKLASQQTTGEKAKAIIEATTPDLNDSSQNKDKVKEKPVPKKEKVKVDETPKETTKKSKINNKLNELEEVFKSDKPKSKTPENKIDFNAIVSESVKEEPKQKEEVRPKKEIKLPTDVFDSVQNTNADEIDLVEEEIIEEEFIDDEFIDEEFIDDEFIDDFIDEDFDDEQEIDVGSSQEEKPSFKPVEDKNQAEEDIDTFDDVYAEDEVDTESNSDLDLSDEILSEENITSDDTQSDFEESVYDDYEDEEEIEEYVFEEDYDDMDDYDEDDFLDEEDFFVPVEETDSFESEIENSQPQSMPFNVLPVGKTEVETSLNIPSNKKEKDEILSDDFDIDKLKKKDQDKVGVFDFSGLEDEDEDRNVIETNKDQEEDLPESELTGRKRSERLEMKKALITQKDIDKRKVYEIDQDSEDEIPDTVIQDAYYNNVKPIDHDLVNQNRGFKEFIESHAATVYSVLAIIIVLIAIAVKSYLFS